MLTFHVPARAGSDEHDYCWEYIGQWGRTVDAINHRSIHPSGLAVFSSSGDEFVEQLGCVVQHMSAEQYAALPANLRRRLAAVRV